jgi:hypothetical protein
MYSFMEESIVDPLHERIGERQMTERILYVAEGCFISGTRSDLRFAFSLAYTRGESLGISEQF